MALAVEEEEEEEEEEVERYCDNEKCPYSGYCFDDVLEEHRNKPYICQGCSDDIPLCVECKKNTASKNEWSELFGEYWTLCDSCYEEDQK